jgi:hypothetical protein
MSPAKMAKRAKVEIKKNGVLFSIRKTFFYWSIGVLECWSVAKTLEGERLK